MALPVVTTAADESDDIGVGGISRREAIAGADTCPFAN